MDLWFVNLFLPIILFYAPPTITYSGDFHFIDSIDKMPVYDLCKITGRSRGRLPTRVISNYTTIVDLFTA